MPRERAATHFLYSAGIEWLPVGAGLLLLYIPTFYDLARTLWKTNDHAHGPIILTIVAWLIWHKRQVLLIPSPGAKSAGLAALILGLLIYLLGRSQEIIAFEVASMAPVLAGALLAMRGWPALRACWFLIFFTGYLVPLPGFVVEALTSPLKQVISSIASQLLYFAGFPIAQSGVILSIGQYQLLVEDACSGLNSMFSLSAVGMLYLYLMRHDNLLRNALVVISLLPIAFSANIVRVVMIVLITFYFGDSAGQGFVHGFSGMVLFVVALTAVLLLDGMLLRFLHSRKSAF